MSIIQSNPSQAIKRFVFLLAAPAWVTLLLSVIASASGSNWGTVFISAFSGQLALTLIKLFFFLAIGLTALGHVFKPLGKFSSFLFWSGWSLAEVAFDNSSVAFGVFLGLTPALMYEIGCSSGGALTFHILLLFGSIAGFSWFAAASERLIGALPSRWQRVCVSVLAFLLAANFFLALYCEQWKEVDGVKFQPNEKVCACMKWPDYITFMTNPAFQRTQ